MATCRKSRPIQRIIANGTQELLGKSCILRDLTIVSDHQSCNNHPYLFFPVFRISATSDFIWSL